MGLTPRQRRQLTKVVARVLRQLKAFLESEENQDRWFTREELVHHLGLREEDFRLGELDAAFARLASLEGVEVRRKRVRSQSRYAWFPWEQLRLSLGMADSDLWHGVPRAKSVGPCDIELG